MSKNSLIQLSQDRINEICQEAGISYLAIFGSQARGDEREDSDVDLLVEFRVTPSLVDFIHTKQEFEKALGRKVDLVTKKDLSKYIKPYIQKDLQQIHG